MKTFSPLRKLLPLWVYVLFFKIGAGLHYSLLSTLGSQVLPLWAVGLAVGGASLFQLLGDVPAGFLLDRFGYTRTLRISTFFFILGAAVFFLGLTPATFFASLVFGTIGWLFFGPGVNAYVLVTAPTEMGGRSIGLFHAFSSAGVVAAALLLSLVVHAHIGVIAAVLAAFLTAAWVIALFMPHEQLSTREVGAMTKRERTLGKRFLPRFFKTLRRLRPAATLLILINLTGCLFYGAIWFVVPLAMAKEANNTFLGISLSIFDLAVALLGSFLGTLADRFDRRILVFLGLLIFAVAATAIGFQFNLWFLLLGFVATTGDELSLVSLWAWLDELDAKHEEDGFITGVTTVFEDLGWTIGPVVAGVLYMLIGPSWTITVCAIPIFLAWILSAFLLRGHGRSRLPRRTRHHRPRHKS